MSQTIKGLAIKLQLADIDLSSIKIRGDESFYKEMCNDLNTPNALTILYASLKEANMMLRNPSTSLEDMKNMFGKLEDYLFILGIKVQYPILQEEDRATYKQYLEAKKEKDFAKSDSLRNVLIEKNIF